MSNQFRVSKERNERGIRVYPITVNSTRQHLKLVNPLTAGATYIRVFIFISTLSTTF